MKKINTYITEKFKISKDINVRNSDDLIEKAFDILDRFNEKKPIKNYGPEFEEVKNSTYNPFRIYPSKTDKDFYIFGKTKTELYWAICLNYGTKEEEKEAKELLKKERDSKK